MCRSIAFRGVLFFIMSLSACQGTAANNLRESPQMTMSVQTLIPARVLNTEAMKSTIVPVDSARTTSVLSTTIATHTPIKSPTQTEIPISMCSPLKDETIPSLWEIITNPFGSPPVGREDLHHGVDFAYYRRGERLSIDGEIIQSILPGTVAASINDRLPYGNMVIIETIPTMLPEGLFEQYDITTGESLYSLYAHMGQSPYVGLGDTVLCGQELGTVGVTGYDIVNPHLHLETRIGPSGVRFKGMAFYDTNASVEEMDNYKWWRTSGDFRNIDPMDVFLEYLSDQEPGFKLPTP
jgi:murein DD-endopeptidase MepM/ murein hydrolase activator NlpD